jgi:hypothetical protein
MPFARDDSNSLLAGPAIICLCLIAMSAEGCTSQDHKWLFYDVNREKVLIYRGYKTTKDAKSTGDLVADIKTKSISALGVIEADKPTIDEDDQLHFVVFGDIPVKGSCHFIETPYAQPHDSKLVPEYKPLTRKMPDEFLSDRIVCDFDARERGSKKIDYFLLKSQKAKSEEIKGDDILLKDSVLVHELFRHRILAGPVFSTLQKKNKNYVLKPNPSGETQITAEPAQDSPGNFVLMLKTYWKKRDVLGHPDLFSRRFLETINPILGINLIDKPLENLYVGLSVEPIGGLDIIGGFHWAKTQQLTEGFSEGQVTTQTNITKERFTNGWFVGVAADVGIVTTWLGKAGKGVIDAIKQTP